MTQLMNQLMNDGGHCRTARAKPGLLNKKYKNLKNLKNPFFLKVLTLSYIGLLCSGPLKIISFT